MTPIQNQITIGAAQLAALLKENESLKLQKSALQHENRTLRQKLDDAEAIMLCNRIFRSEPRKNTFYAYARESAPIRR